MEPCCYITIPYTLHGFLDQLMGRRKKESGYEQDMLANLVQWTGFGKDLELIEVGQPVTRLPPRSPLRAELPHKVPQKCSLCAELKQMLFSAVRFASFIQLYMSGRNFLCGLRTSAHPFPM